MGDAKVTALTILAFLKTASVLSSPVSGNTAFATTLAPREMKKEKKIQIANAASADVAILRKIMEKRIATPNQKEM